MCDSKINTLYYINLYWKSLKQLISNPNAQDVDPNVESNNELDKESDKESVKESDKE